MLNVQQAIKFKENTIFLESSSSQSTVQILLISGNKLFKRQMGTEEEI